MECGNMRAGGGFRFSIDRGFAAPGTYTVKITPPSGYASGNTSTTLRVAMFEVARVDFVMTR